MVVASGFIPCQEGPALELYMLVVIRVRYDGDTLLHGSLVDHGEGAPGYALWKLRILPYQQYPVKVGSSMGRQFLSTCKSAGSITMSRKMGESTRAPPRVTADTNGPAQFNLSQNMGTMSPYNPKVTTLTKREMREVRMDKNGQEWTRFCLNPPHTTLLTQ